MERSLTVSDLHFSYGRESAVLRGLSAAFTPGKITALLGANGCGKSTLVNLIAGLSKPQRGQVLLDGRAVHAMPRSLLARRMAVVHQSSHAPADMTVEALVRLGRTPYRRLLRKPDAADMRAVERAMEETDVAALSGRPVSTLSGGQRQRVWLAMALAQETDILLLDEFTTYLDIHYQLELLHLLTELNRSRGITILAVLHDIDLAYAHCHEALVLKDGAALAQGTVERVVNAEILAEAFDVSARILSVNGRRHCVFGRQGEIP